jgi:UDP-3-O-[3-hydroxymyristoyl] glucosamine N-acyltransferase
MDLTLNDIAALLNCPAPPGGERRVTGMATLADATETEISLLGSDKYRRDFAGTRALAVIVGRDVRLPQGNKRPIFLVDNADLAQARVLERLAPPIPRPPAGVDPAARVASSAVLGEGVAVGPFVVVGQRTRIGAGTVLHAGVFVGDDVVIGRLCEFFPNVVVRERVTIGSRVIIHASSVLGSDGFGYTNDGPRIVKIPQIGTIVIEDDVEIGSCVCVDRAKFGNTRIGRGTKIDNLVQVAHNVQIGPYCIIVGQVGLAGSAKLGAGVVLGGQSAVRDHVTVGDGSKAAARAAVTEDVEPGITVSGMPAIHHRQNLREQAALRRLPHLMVQVRQLEEEIAKLKAGK